MSQFYLSFKILKIQCVGPRLLRGNLNTQIRGVLELLLNNYTFIIAVIIFLLVEFFKIDFIAFGPSNILSTFKMHIAGLKSRFLQYTC